jgi:hypothetical protein
MQFRLLHLSIYFCCYISFFSYAEDCSCYLYVLLHFTMVMLISCVAVHLANRFNLFINREDPLKDEKNKQMVTLIDIVTYLKPKFVVIENVVDILKFANGFLDRYALSRFMALNYQSRLGLKIVECYGLLSSICMYSSCEPSRAWSVVTIGHF